MVDTAEQAVLGAMMTSSDAAGAAMERLSAEDFTDPFHRDVWRAIVQILSDGRKPDTSAVADELSGLGEDGYLRLHSMVSMAPANRPERSVAKLADLAARRRYADAGREIQRAAEDESASVEQVTETAMRAITSAVIGREAENGVIVPDVDSLLAFYDDPTPEGGLSTGWVSLDDFYTVRRGDMTVVGGHPYHGKSSFVASLAVNMAMEHGWRFVVWTPEHVASDTEQRSTRYLRKLVERYLGKAMKARKRLGRDPNLASRGQVAEGGEWVRKHFRLLAPASVESWNVPTLLGLAQIIRPQFPFDGIILDPWTELSLVPPEGMSETAFIGQELSRAKRYAQATDTHLWIVAHPTKAVPESQVPELRDISGSAHFRNKTDCGIGVWRNPHDEKPHHHPVEIHIQKVREDAVGRQGMVELQWHPPSGRFHETRPI